MNIGELAVKIGIIGGKESVATMNQLQTTTLATKAAVIGAVVAFAKMSQEARKLAMNLEIFEKTTGVSGDALQKISYQAAAAGVNLDDVAGTLQSIQQMTTDIALGQGNIEPFQMWGIGVDKDPTKVFSQISSKLKELQQTSPALASKMASDFGLSNKMLYLILEGQTEELEEQYLLRSRDKESLVALNKQWYKLLWYVKQIGIRTQGFLAHVALPILKAITNIVKFVGDIVIGFGELVSRSLVLRDILVIISALVLTILAWCFPITAAIIGIALALEDVYGYFSGKDSITGRMIEWIKSGQILKDIFMTIAEIIRSVSKMIFGNKFTKKAFDFMAGKDENGNAKPTGLFQKLSSFDLSKPGLGILPNLFDFAKPALASGGNFNITQHNVANFVSSGSVTDDAQAAGAYNKSSAISDAEMQEAELARQGK